MRKSDLAINSFISGLRLKLPSSSGCTLQTATELRRTSDMDVRSHVFSLRRALKLRSACADAAGETSSRRISWQTCEYSAHTSGSLSTASFLPLLVPEKRLAVYAKTSAVVVPSLECPALDTMTTRLRCQRRRQRSTHSLVDATSSNQGCY